MQTEIAKNGCSPLASVQSSLRTPRRPKMRLRKRHDKDPAFGLGKDEREEEAGERRE